MTTDRDCAIICQATYNDEAFFDSVVKDDQNIWLGIKNYPDHTVIAFRGSCTFLDWMKDFEARFESSPVFGDVEYGFYDKLPYIAVDIVRFLERGKALIITGHSLGGARAVLFGALLKNLGWDNYSVVTFGAPRPGTQKLADYLSNIPIRQYRNNDDMVTHLPYAVPGFLYSDVRQYIQVNAAPVRWDNWGLLADHHIELYVQAMRYRDVNTD